METAQGQACLTAHLMFPAYLQGMETSGTQARQARNLRSQPTYKEWKLAYRNGVPFTAEMFPAYLQGMETSRGRKGT